MIQQEKYKETTVASCHSLQAYIIKIYSVTVEESLCSTQVFAQTFNELFTDMHRYLQCIQGNVYKEM